MNKSIDAMKGLFVFTNALYYMYYNMHWKFNHYGSHMLYERLYEDIEEELDGIAEKLLGIFVNQDIINPAQDLADASKLLSELMPQNASADQFHSIAIEAEKKYLEAIKESLDILEQDGSKTDGIEDLLQGIANKHEEHLYLLQQRDAGPKREASIGVLARLYKVAYYLDRKSAYNEARKIEEVMESMADRMGLDLKDLVALADHFDQIGETVLADRFDEMAKEAAEKTKPKPPKKWWKKMTKEIKESSPDYSKERVDETVGDIWFNNLTDAKRKEIIERDGTKEKKKWEKEKGRI